MKILIITLLLITCILSLKVLKHKCQHDKIRKNQKYESIPPDQESLDIRNLQNLQPRNMIISYDMSFYKTLASNEKIQNVNFYC
ncbi:hypothetical protein IMG5_205610 [Ichthyophthirius multifiliis]|uniref:Uncharacterized protein n=1 Tax=Ichthyophthirius multifiliis TaxID=5932 RepID=G0R6J9_ICHMU|nr:hypothetical protein IMG5_205610 [Ichthyophthirius multifiliis]EGR26909.1 hypothetical protein IMG5_205610 [Ichthyophthirius multifiliis]|eukprot:XP_004023793.1 hypothetical protein IMG5_205610 [Ichthyophthirius multifiliis]